ncbi:DUF192 domain-containing protein [Sediminispirochaeta bajacaliforniensis]|uniref:DUF192 domain-containing protein n=1 Tax=Sediminispirochaeta bajacaliforniensis TaxID=148 RepID=UPI0003604A26|nr:DUF192 domain-containing protein [Sediminispirochaeta bajacaliforniensis]
MRLSVRFLFGFCFFLVLLSGCKGEQSVTLSIGTKQFTLEIADDQQERVKGLMFREKLSEDRGMIFVFEHDQLLGFWMKNTEIPLSIAYLDGSGTIVDILPMIPHDLQPVYSSRSVRYAIELNRGAFEAAGVREGDHIDLAPLISRQP